MKKLILCMLFGGFVCFQSCVPEQEAKWQWEGKIGEGGEMYVCCMSPGNNCYRHGAWGYTTTFRKYVEDDNLAGYFKNENWQNEFSQLTDQPEIIDAIISTNPKGVFLGEVAFVILKDRKQPPLTDNVLVAFKAGSPECDKVFSTLPVVD